MQSKDTVINTMKSALITRIVVLSLTAVFLVGALIYGLGTGFGLKMFIKKDFVYTKTYEYTQEIEDLDSLDIAWLAGDVELKYYDGANIKITEMSTVELNNDEILRLEVDGNVLKVKWNDGNKFLGWMFSMLGKKLTVEIPRGMYLEEVAVNSASSNIAADGITAKAVKLQSTSGGIKANSVISEELALKSTSGGITANMAQANVLSASTVSGSISLADTVGIDSKVSSTSGAIEYKGSFKNLAAKSVSGRIDAMTLALVEKVKLEAVSGSVNLTVPEDVEAKVKFGSVSGSFSSTLQNTLKWSKSGEFDVGSSQNEITLSTTSGSINLGAGGTSTVLSEIAVTKQQPES